jgi:hypothetical protein
VATGIEKAVGRNSGMVVKAKNAGTVTFVDAERIIVDNADEYVLRKFVGLNERTCLNQRPVVKIGQKVEIVPESDQQAKYPGEVIRIAAVMGARKLRSDDPSERADERVVEVVVNAEAAPVLVGQRVLVKFLKDGAEAAPVAATPVAGN